MASAHKAPAGGASPPSLPVHQQEKTALVSAQQMSDLLRRYPDVSQAEKLQLIDFLKRGHPETLAMVTYGSGLVSQVGTVKKDHPEHFPSGWRSLLPWFGLLVIALVLKLVVQLI